MKRIIILLAMIIATTCMYAQINDGQLTTNATLIKNANTNGFNTATRIGNMFIDVINSKINADKLVTTLGNTDTKIPTEKAVKDYVDAAVSTGGGGTQVVQIAKVTVSSAEILALNSSHKVLIAAPGAGKFIIINKVVLKYNYGTTSYNSTALSIGYSDINSSGSIALSVVTGNSNSAYFISTRPNDFTMTNIENSNVILSALGALSGGDGTLDVYISYTIVTL